MSKLDWRRLSLAPFRLRILFRGAFLLLALATVAMALFVLREEQQLSYRNYAYGFNKNTAQIVARLRHPAGQLALLNPPREGAITPLRPFLLPFSGLDFDDQAKVQQAVEMAGCMVQYPDTAGVCVAVGNNAYSGGFVYVVGRFVSGTLVEHARGDRRLDGAHRLRIQLELRGQRYAWIAPFESIAPNAASVLRGRLTGFVDSGDGVVPKRPVKDFRGWLWQSRECLEAKSEGDCRHRSFFSVRLPVDVLRDALFEQQQAVWPPPDLDRIVAHVQVLGPGDGAPLFDSDATGATPPFSLHDLAPLLLPGETLVLRKLGPAEAPELIRLVGADPNPQPTARWIDRLIRHLAKRADDAPNPIEARQTIATPSGSYELHLTGDVRTANQNLAAVTTRVSWFVGAMLLAIGLVWLVIETSVMRRINALRRRADKVSRTVKATEGLEGFDLSDLRGRDELGVLAACLADLLRRVQEDLAREQIRAEQEKDQWHAVGHEIMSPLQSLMVLHSDDEDPSRRYISRMQQAIRVLYGSASPSEAFQSTTLQLLPIDLEAFMDNVARNAGIENVEFGGTGKPVFVRADEYSLEDVMTHVLTNAERHRTPGSTIRIRLEASDTSALLSIHNEGEPIAETVIERIFEYGVSDAQDAGAQGHRGQGLFVAKTYMAKMGGTITAQNVDGGVSFFLQLPRAISVG